MRKGLLTLIFSVLVLIALACAPKTSLPTQTAQEKAPSEVKEARQVEWERLVSEARKEGRVSIYGPAWGDLGQLLREGFKKEYPGIEVEYIGLEGRNLSPRVMAERRAGIYLVDIIIAGTTTILTVFKEMGVPIEPLIIHPEARDPKAWREGKIEFADEEGKLNLVIVNTIVNPAIYNTERVDGKKLEGASWWEFTRPEWKDKLLMNDPRLAGAGLANATFIYTTPGLGLDYMRSLAKNGVVIGQDHRIMAEWVARGKYLAQLFPTTVVPRILIKEGAPLAFVETMKEGAIVSASSGSLIFLDKAPHPKAAQLFLNWFLGKEGQYIVSKVSELPSNRIDIPKDHLDPKSIPKPGVIYQPSHKEEYVKLRDEISRHMREIFGRT